MKSESKLTNAPHGGITSSLALAAKIQTRGGSMEKLARPLRLMLIVSLLTWLSPVSPATASNEVFLSNDTAQSEVTYVIRFDTSVKGNIDRVRITLPSGTNAANAALGRVIIDGKGEHDGEHDREHDATLSFNPSNTLIVDLRDEHDVKAGTKILVELFNLKNPMAGISYINVSTLKKNGQVLENISPIAFSSLATGTGDITGVNVGTGLTGGGLSGDVTLSILGSYQLPQLCSNDKVAKSNGAGGWFCADDNNSGGDITEVNTLSGSGLTGGATSGSVTLSLQSCPADQVLKSLGSSWTCAASGGTITGVTAGTGLAGGGTSGNVTLNNTGVLSVTGGTGISITGSSGNFTITNTGDTNAADDITSLTAGTGISITGIGNSRTISATAAGGGVTAVTASLPLTYSGGSTPNISLPGVIIDDSASLNTAIGSGALFGNTGFENTASGYQALFNNSGNNNTASGYQALLNNGGGENTASGYQALANNTTGAENTAIGSGALFANTTGSDNTAIGFQAGVSADNLTNATAIGAGAIVDTDNTIRLGNGSVAYIYAQVGISTTSDKTKKENFQPVDGEEVLKKVGDLALTSWNFIGHDPKQFRHYGPMAQDFFAAFGHDGVGTIGTPTTISSTDMAGILMIAAQTLEKRTAEQREEIKRLNAENADLKARLESLEQKIGSYAMR